jgi:hypothetical protein
MSYQQKPYPGPYGGIVDDVPRPYKSPADFDDILNFFVREGRLQSRPRLNTFGNPPDTAVLRNMITYQDVLNNYHTLALTTQTAYALSAGPTYNILTVPGGLSLAGTALPYGWAIVNGKVFFSNGSTDVLYADGSNSLQQTVDVPGAARFMCVMASHLLLGYTTEPRPGQTNSTQFQQRVRWSKSGDPTTWTTSSAGFNDLLDIPDGMTGLVALGRNGYVFRKNGVTTISPIGPANAPFIFDNISISPVGVGNAYPYSLASFGSWAVFVSQDDVYLFDGGTFTPIGGGSRKKIFADLANASGDQVVGFIVPSLGVNYPFLSYWLSIPGVNISWVFYRVTGKWVRFSSSAGRLTCLAQVAVS